MHWKMTRTKYITKYPQHLTGNDIQACVHARCHEEHWEERLKPAVWVKIKMNIFPLLIVINISLLFQGKDFQPQILDFSLFYLAFSIFFLILHDDSRDNWIVFSCFCIMTKAFWLVFKRKVDKNTPHTNKTLSRAETKHNYSLSQISL